MASAYKRGMDAMVKSLENTADYYARNANKPTAAAKVKSFIDRGTQQRVKALENTADHYYTDWINKNDSLWKRLAGSISKEEDATQPTTLGTINPKDDEDVNAYLRDITAKASRATDNSRTAVSFSNDTQGKWFKAGAFSDGWQPGDVYKSTVATNADLKRNVAAGVLGTGEKAADSAVMLGAWSYGGLMPAKEGSIYPVYSFSMEEREKDKQRAAEFAAKDLYDEEALAERIYTNYLERNPGIDIERDSWLGEDSRNLAKEAGELAAVYTLQAAGVPWWLTSGVNAFGSEVEHAARDGATFNEAAMSGLVSAGAEVLVGTISKGIKYKGKPAGDFMAREICNYISNEFLASVIKLGINSAGEGTKEVFEWAIGKFGQWLTYQDDKTLGELLTSKDALDEATESFWRGFILEGLPVNGIEHARVKKNGSDRTAKPEYTSISKLSSPASSSVSILPTRGKVPLLPATSISANAATNYPNSATGLSGNVYSNYIKRITNNKNHPNSQKK